MIVKHLHGVEDEHRVQPQSEQQGVAMLLETTQHDHVIPHIWQRNGHLNVDLATLFPPGKSSTITLMVSMARSYCGLRRSARIMGEQLIQDGPIRCRMMFCSKGMNGINIVQY